MDPILKTVLASWNWRADVIAVVALLTTVYVIGWRRLRRRSVLGVKKIDLALYLTSQAALALGLLVAQSTAWANGGTPRLSGAIVGPYTVSVWTKPEPPRVGRIHVSVALMRVQDRSPILDARVRVAAEPVYGQENSISANTSRSWGLLYDTDLQIPSEGPWRIDLQVEGKAGTGSTGFELDVRPPPKVNWPVVGATAVLVLAVLAAWWVIRHGKSCLNQKQGPG